MAAVTTHFQSTALDNSETVPVRTELSKSFEAFWRSLPKTGLVPSREAFRPESAPRFLRHLVLAEVRLSVPSICIRLAGTEFERRLQASVKDLNYLEFVAGEDLPVVIQRAREIVERPCGVWEIRETHYERGYAQQVENTSFPLRSEEGGVNLLLVLTQSLGRSITPEATDGKFTRTRPTALCHYIDVGAGTP